MIQEYVWELPSPAEGVDELAQLLVGPMQEILDHNRWVSGAWIDLQEESVHVVLRMKGHDRWWIRRRSPFLITSILTRVSYPTEQVRHVEIITVPNLKKARFKTEDGKRVWEPPDGSEPGPQVQIRPCKKCRDQRLREKYWSRGMGWKTGAGAYVKPRFPTG